MCLCHTALSWNVVTCARSTIGCIKPYGADHRHESSTHSVNLWVPNACFVNSGLRARHSPLEPTMAHLLSRHSGRVQSASKHAPPCLVPGYRDTSKWVTAEKDRVTRVSNGLSVVIQIRDLTLSKSCIKLVKCVQAVHDLTLSNHRVKLVKYIQVVHDLTLSYGINSLMHPNLSN